MVYLGHQSQLASGMTFLLNTLKGWPSCEINSTKTEMAFPKGLSLPPENHHTFPALSAVTNTVMAAMSLTQETKGPSGCWAATLLTPRPQSAEGMGRPETHNLKNGGG